jgi:DNA-binding NarL/FixJ family response regulator
VPSRAVLDGLAATRQIVAAAATEPSMTAVKVIILTTYDLAEYVYQARPAGACGLLLKHAPPEELLLGSGPPPTAGHCSRPG